MIEIKNVLVSVIIKSGYGVGCTRCIYDVLASIDAQYRNSVKPNVTCLFGIMQEYQTFPTVSK